MEENIVLSNFATIITKDIIIDESKTLKNHGVLIGPSRKHYDFALLELADDEDLKYYQRYRQMLKNKARRANLMKTAKRHIQKLTSMAEQTKSQQRKYPLINLLNSYDVNIFEGHLHLSKLSFLYMFQVIKNVICDKRFPVAIAMQTVFSISLWKLTTDEHFEVISSKFDIPLDDCQLIIHTFWNVIAENYEEFIKWPNTEAAQQQTIAGFRANAKLQIFQELFGVIALKRLNVFLDHDDGEVPVILQIICNADKKVIDCYVELADNYCFETTPIGRILETNETSLPRGCYLLGDLNFPSKPYLICPITTPGLPKEHAFNELLQPVAELVREVLDTIAKRFNILYALEAKDLQQVRAILDTVCALHNVCIDIEDDYVARKREVVTFNWANDDDNVPIKPQYNERANQRRAELIDAILKF